MLLVVRARPHGTHHESDGPLLIDVDGNVGALDPGVGAEMPQPNVGVSGGQTIAA